MSEVLRKACKDWMEGNLPAESLNCDVLDSLVLFAKQQQAAVWREAGPAQVMWQNDRAKFYRTYHCDTFLEWCEQKAKDLDV